MKNERQTEWVCPTCRGPPLASEPGQRCSDHPDQVLVPVASLEHHGDDRVLGRVVGGKYAVYDVLGVGGFGAVYRALQEPVGRAVALKVVHPQHAREADLRARFFREARLVARLKDPAVVTLYDYGEAPDLGLYIVFELVEGITLNRLLAEGPQQPARVTHILLQLLRAVGEAHSLGMVHRDLKPANVMLIQNSAGEETVRLLDFGIAKVVSQDSKDHTLQTQRGLMMGTPRYLSPEQARAAGDIDHRTDLYSLGVLGYALIAGANPFERASVIETIMAHCNTRPPPLAPELGVPLALEAVLLQAMEKKPDARFQSAREMATALRAALPNVSFPTGHWRVHAEGASLAETPPRLFAPAPGTGPAHSGAESIPGLSAGLSTGDAPPRISAMAGPPSPSGSWTDASAGTPRPAPRGLGWLPVLAAVLLFLLGGAVVVTITTVGPPEVAAIPVLEASPPPYPDPSRADRSALHEADAVQREDLQPPRSSAAEPVDIVAEADDVASDIRPRPEPPNQARARTPARTRPKLARPRSPEKSADIAKEPAERADRARSRKTDDDDQAPARLHVPEF